MTVLDRAAGVVNELLSAADCHSAPSGHALARAVLMAVRDGGLDDAEMRQMTETYGPAFAAIFRVRFAAMIDAILSEPQQ